MGGVVDDVDVVTAVGGSNGLGGSPALLPDNAGVGAVELLAVSRQSVVDQMVDNGLIKKSTYVSQRRHRRARCRAFSAKLSCSQR